VRRQRIAARLRDLFQWKSSSSFSLSDLPVAIAVLDLAFEHLASQEAVIES
jgi:hypothetical protein